MNIYPTYDRSFLGRTRDRVAHATVNFILNHIATEWYRKMISGTIRLGLASAADRCTCGKQSST